MTPDPESAVLLARSAYDLMISAAREASADAAKLEALLHAIDILEDSRAEYRLDPIEQDILRSVVGDFIGDGTGYYPLVHEDPKAWPTARPVRQLWQGEDDQGRLRKIHVLDVLPFPSDRIESLARKGYLRFMDTSGLKQPPLKTFRRHPVSDRYGGEWKSVRDSDGWCGSAWLVSGSGHSVAWTPDYNDANYLAACINAIIKLECDVRRYGGSPNPSFPSFFKRQGIFQLVDILIQSIRGSEQWEKEPPLDLQERGKQLAADLRRFYRDANPHRVSRPIPPE